jgi:hypothetical protein
MKVELRFCLAAAMVATLAAADVSAQGWGMRRLDVTLTRKLPSAINFTGNTVKVRLEAKSEGQVPRQVVDIFRSRLTAEVFKDSRVVEDKNAPDAIVDATINEFSSSTTPVQRSYFNLQARKNIAVNNRIIQGQVRVSYRTLDGRTGKGLDSGNLRFAVQQEFAPTGEPHRDLFVKRPEPFKRLPGNEELYQYLVDGIVMEVSKRLVSVDESITVPLPRGKLEPASKLGAASRWGAMLEAAERMSEFPRPEDEAFRQYAIGIANEALAYQETDRGQVQDLLAKAALAYKKAIEAGPGEDVFQTAQNRMATYVDSPPAVATTGEQAGGNSRGVSLTPAAGAGAMTNQDVIKFAREKFSDDFLLETINGAASVAFDLSTDSLVELKRSGVSERVIKGMREKMAATGTGKRPPESN